MTELLLVRHGETAWNAERRFQGHADPPLNELGRAQARALAAELADEALDAVYSSDLRRARETAEIVAERLGIEIVPRRDLREIDVGDWEGLTWEEIEARFPERRSHWEQNGHGWSGGETYEQLGERVVAALREIASAHPGGRVLVVGHGGTIRSVRAHVDGTSVAESRRRTPAIRNCELVRIRAEDGRFRGLD